MKTLVFFWGVCVMGGDRSQAASIFGWDFCWAMDEEKCEILRNSD